MSEILGFAKNRDRGLFTIRTLTYDIFKSVWKGGRAKIGGGFSNEEECDNVIGILIAQNFPVSVESVEAARKLAAEQVKGKAVVRPQVEKKGRGRPKGSTKKASPRDELFEKLKQAGEDNYADKEFVPENLDMILTEDLTDNMKRIAKGIRTGEEAEKAFQILAKFMKEVVYTQYILNPKIEAYRNEIRKNKIKGGK